MSFKPTQSVSWSDVSDSLALSVATPLVLLSNALVNLNERMVATNIELGYELADGMMDKAQEMADKATELHSKLTEESPLIKVRVANAKVELAMKFLARAEEYAAAQQ